MSISFSPDIQSPFIANIDWNRYNFEIQKETKFAVPAIMGYTVYDITWKVISQDELNESAKEWKNYKGL